MKIPLLSSDKKGIKCEPMENGIQRCQVFTQEKNGAPLVSSKFSYAVDEDCEARPVGTNYIMEEDEDKINEVLKNASASCRRGIWAA